MRAIRRFGAMVASAAAFIGVAPGAAVAVPANDSISSPEALTLPYHVVSSSNVGATAPDPNEPLAPNNRNACTPTGGIWLTPPPPPAFSVGLRNTLWWSLTGTGRTITVATGTPAANGGSDFDTVLAVYGPGAPFNFLRCNDDVTGLVGAGSSALSFASQAGGQYLVQVGGCDSSKNSGCGPFEGKVVLRAGDQPSSDQRASADRIEAGPVIRRNNFGATTEPGEPLSCNGHAYGKTLWFAWDAPNNGTASFTVTGNIRSAIGAYSGSRRLPCDIDVSNADPSSDISFHADAGRRYLIQIGGIGSGLVADFGTPIQLNPKFTRSCDGFDTANDGFDQDCVDGDAIDRDGDGWARKGRKGQKRDCNDGNRKINPRAREIKGNRVDENCNGRKAPFDRLPTDVRPAEFRYPAGGSPTFVVALMVTQIKRGSRVVVRCRGRGCPFRAARVRKFCKGRARHWNLAGLFRRRPLGVRTRIEVRVTRRNAYGKRFRFTVRSNHVPSRREYRIRASRRSAC